MKQALMMIRFSALVVVALFTLLRPMDATTVSTAMTTSLLSAPSLEKQQSTLSAASAAFAEQKERSLESDSSPSGYVFYSMPPFALSFRSPAYLLSSQEQVDDVLLARRLSATLIDIVSEFLLESFRQEIAIGTSDPSIPEMVRQLVKMNFQVKLEYRKTVVEGEEDAQRRRLLQQQQQEQEPKEWFTLYITFAGMSYFVAPVVRSESSYSNTNSDTASSSSTVVASLPSQEYMSDLLGGWIEKYMTNDYSILKQALRASDEPLLQQLESLLVFTNVGAPGGSFGTSGSTARAPSQSYMTPMDTVLTILVVIVSMATLGAAFFLVRPYWLSRRKEQFILQSQQQLGAFPTTGATTSSSTLNTSTRGGGLSGLGDEPSLPGRGHEYDPELGPEDEQGEEEEQVVFDEKHSVVAESDRWLQQHRPDLLAVIQRTSQRDLMTTGVEDPTSSSSSYREDDPDTIMKVNSNCSKRSNPLQYLYGGMFIKNQQPKRPPALNELQRANSLASQDGQVVIQGDDDNNSNNASNEQNVAGPTWWGKLASSLQVVGGDGRHRGTLPCDEDPRRYTFPYQDFPRSDGTPCLIYEEGQEGSNGPVTLRRRSDNLSPQAADAIDDCEKNPSNPRLLSNDAFKRQLSMHSINSSLEDRDDLQQQESNILDGMNGSGLDQNFEVLGDYLNDDNGDDDDDDDDIDDNSSAGSNPKFTSKLERLVAMRHRHYEQETILQKARQKKQDRQKAEARERELKLRRHEMELDVEEIEASLTPRALQRKRSTGTRYGNNNNNGDASGSIVPGNSTPNSRASHYARSASNVTPIASNTTNDNNNNINKPFPHDEGGNGEQRKFHRSSHSNPDLMYAPSSAATAISDLTSSTQGSWSGGCNADIAAAAGFAPSVNGGGSNSNKSGGGASGSGSSGSGSGGPSLRREDAQTTGTSKPPAPRQIPRSNSGAPPSPHPTHCRSQTSERSSSLSTLHASQQKQLPQAPPSPSPSQKSKTNRKRFSHRRSYSHGTQQNPFLIPSMEEKKDNDSGTPASDGKSHKRNGSNAEDVLAFGIAAYTDFV